MRHFLYRLGFILCVVAVGICIILHLATFLLTVSPTWLILPFFLVFGAVLCAQAGERKRPTIPRGKWRLLSGVLVLYAVMTFVYFYRVTGGATSVGGVDGQYVSESKTRVLRTISEREFRMFPNLFTRAGTAWVGMMAAFCATIFVPITDRALPRNG